MSVANNHIFVLAPSLAILFLAGLLVVCWLIQRQQRFLLWLGTAYALAAIPLGFRSIAPFEVLNRHLVTAGALYLLGTWCLAMSLAERRHVSTRPRAALLVGALSLTALFYFTHVDPNLWFRLHLFSFGTGLILLLPVPAVFRNERPKYWLDQALLWSYMAYAVFTMLRPLLTLLLGYTELGDFLHSTSAYWVITLMSTLFFALLFTVLMCAVTIRETVDKLRRERDHDTLTKILNRRAFYETAQQRLADQRLYPIAILAGDIDHFKRINDAWGHDRGDLVLQFVSSTLQRNVRSNDLVARFGGEEFVLLLTRIDLEDAERVAQRIRFELSSDSTTLPHGPQLTMSFGISAITDPSQLENALKEADELLYGAKNAGRDRVHVIGRIYPDISFEHTIPMGEIIELPLADSNPA